jgi:hypothetical protein
LLLLLGLLGPPCRAAAPPATPLSRARIKELVRQLGSGEFRTREEASRQLQYHPEAEPALRQALSSTDAEVVRRARSLLAGLARARLVLQRQRLRVDDLVTEVDGSVVRPPLAFTQLLRKRLVQGGETRLRVRRDGKSIDVRVPPLR